MDIEMPGQYMNGEEPSPDGVVFLEGISANVHVSTAASHCSHDPIHLPSGVCPSCMAPRVDCSQWRRQCNLSMLLWLWLVTATIA